MNGDRQENDAESWVNVIRTLIQSGKNGDASKEYERGIATLKGIIQKETLVQAYNLMVTGKWLLIN